MKRLLFLALAAVNANCAFAGPDLPHMDLVSKYLQNATLTASTIDSCKGAYMTPEDDDLPCWAAHVVKDMMALTPEAHAFVLNNLKRNAAISKCQALSMKERFDSRECAAAGQADSFISLRLPRMKLEPVQFK